MKKNFLKEIEKYDFNFKKEIKKVFNLITDQKIIDWENIEVTSKFLKKIILLTNKKLNGEDITFEIGYRYFRNNKIILKKNVFVPQFDTEQIVDLVLQKNIINGKALEIGSGSGAIAISLSKETNLNIISIDKNKKATKLSKKNDSTNKVSFLHKDFEKFKSSKKFDLLISNPPYIEYEDEDVEEWVKENQPYEALYAKNNGLYFYELIFNNIKNLMNKNSFIILEMGQSQAKSILKLASPILKELEIIKDYSGLDRFLVGKYE